MSADVLARGMAAQARGASGANTRSIGLLGRAVQPPGVLPQFTVMAAPPTITITDASAASTIASPVVLSPINAAMFKTGTPTVVVAGQGHTPSDGAGVAASDKYMCWEFMSDAQTIEFGLVNFNSKFDIHVDDMLVRASQFSLSANGQFNQTKLDWTADAFPRKPRLYRVSGFNLRFSAVYLDAGGSIWFPQERTTRKLIAFLGDSYTQSTGAASVARTYAGAIAARLGMDLYADGVGSMGWNSAGGNAPTARIAKGIAVMTRAPDYVVTAMGYNDKSADAAGIVALKASYDAAVAALRASWPKAQVLTMGPWTPGGGQTDLSTVRAALIERATALGSPFLDINNIVNPANMAAYTGGDNVHPTALGHQYLGWRAAALIRPLL
ncbi:MAG: hypothetical protein JWM75_273 [Sphingomonas bacterium]|nr:hypothetical protein [Sphingomonas bacterium]